VVALGLLATHRRAVMAAMENGPGRALFGGITALVPPLGRMAEVAGAMASSGPLAPGSLLRLLLGTLAFTAALLAVAGYRFERKDF